MSRERQVSSRLPQANGPREWRSVVRRAVGALVVFSVVCVVVDACFVEPDDVVLEVASIHANVRASLVVAHLSDLHAGELGVRESRAIALLEAAHPDLVVVTGDVVDGGTLEPARAFFQKLHAPLGVLVVRGNWEHWRPPPDERAFYASVGAKLLVNEGLAIRDDVWVAGLEDESSATPDLAKALVGAPSTGMKIGLFHSPSFFDRASASFQFAFAGHTHGGQVRIPFMAPPWLPDGSGRFVSGFYTRGGSQMHVSRGIGTSIAPIRFACKPEVTVVTFVPAGP